MYIQRYLAKDEGNVEAFEEHYREISLDFDFYVGSDKIGVSPNPSTKADCFMGGILVHDDELIITPSEKSPRIERASDKDGEIQENGGCRDEISELVKLIQGNEVTHMYMASETPGGYAHILTFSPDPPSKELYKKGDGLDVLIDEDALQLEDEFEKMLKYQID